MGAGRGHSGQRDKVLRIKEAGNRLGKMGVVERARPEAGAELVKSSVKRAGRDPLLVMIVEVVVGAVGGLQEDQVY